MLKCGQKDNKNYTFGVTDKQIKESKILNKSYLICPKCAKVITESSNFCPFCGKEL